MKRARARIKALTARSQVGRQLEGVIARLNLFLRGWGNYFRTAATCGRDKPTAGPAPGSTTRACTSSWALSDTRKLARCGMIGWDSHPLVWSSFQDATWANCIDAKA